MNSDNFCSISEGTQITLNMDVLEKEEKEKKAFHEKIRENHFSYQDFIENENSLHIEKKEDSITSIDPRNIKGYEHDNTELKNMEFKYEPMDVIVPVRRRVGEYFLGFWISKEEMDRTVGMNKLPCETEEPNTEGCDDLHPIRYSEDDPDIAKYYKKLESIQIEHAEFLICRTNEQTKCHFCSQNFPAGSYYTLSNDTCTYTWSNSYLHYLRDHQVKMNNGFKKFIMTFSTIFV